MLHRLKDYGYEVSTGPWYGTATKASLRKAGKKRLPAHLAEAVTADGRFSSAPIKKTICHFSDAGRDDWLITRTACVLLQRTPPRNSRAASLQLNYLPPLSRA